MDFDSVLYIAPFNLEREGGKKKKGRHLPTYVGCDDPLRALHVSAYLALAGLQHGDALIGKHIEHIPHTQP